MSSKITIVGWLSAFYLCACSLEEVPQKPDVRAVDASIELAVDAPTPDRTIDQSAGDQTPADDLRGDAGVTDSSPDGRSDQRVDKVGQDTLLADVSSGPTPPFGSTVGLTAEDFTIGDCDDKPFALHAQYGSYPAVVLLLNDTSFIWSSCYGVSRWLTTDIKAKYPSALVIEVKRTPISEADCKRWIDTFTITHLLLRDDGQAESKLAMTSYDILVMNRELSITYRGSNASATATQLEVENALAALIP